MAPAVHRSVLVGIWTPSHDANKTDQSIHWKAADLFSEQNLPLFMQSCAEEFRYSPHDMEAAFHIQVSFCTLLGAAVMAMYQHVVDCVGLAGCQWAKLLWSVIKDVHFALK